MNVMTAADQMKRAKELKAKFYGAPTVKNVASKTVEHTLSEEQRIIQEQAAKIFEMKATIAALQAMVLQSLRKDGLVKSANIGDGTNPMQAVARVLSERHPSMSFAHVVGKNRTAGCIAARWDCVREVARQFPGMSQAEIAKMFKKDRSSISNILGTKRRSK